ncbi:hypothetical protein MED01_000483 [Micromonospora sp. MED01]|uniref:hypothetical protein n=1 Tax=Micromonospora alfalfae TaxID=2911212 RepID=UPI001EE91B08|nr:hypothetical protein [Micromonospora alfalfae]MCG5462382.1 hypothetical protein [Micromonospora alfalfae]
MGGSLYILLPFAAITAIVLFFALFIILWAVTAILLGFHAPNDKTLPAILTVSVSLTALIGASLGAIYAFRKQILAEREGLRADQQVYSDRYVKAAELLAHERPSARLAGLHSLAILADDWREGRTPCVMAICSYLRLPNLAFGGEERNLGEQEVQRTAWKSIRARLLNLDSEHSWNDQELDFSGGHFQVVDLDQVKLAGAMVQFRNCTFRDGEIRLRGAVIEDALVDFTGSTFKNMKILLSGMKVKGRSVVSFDEVESAGSSFALDRMHIENDATLLIRRAEISDSELLFDSNDDLFYLHSRSSNIDGEVEFSDSKLKRTNVHMYSYSLSGRLVFADVETEDVEISIPPNISGTYVNLDVKPAGPTRIRIGPGRLSDGDLRIRPRGGQPAVLDVDITDFELSGGELRIHGDHPCWKALRVDLAGEQKGRLVISGRFSPAADVDIDSFAEIQRY